MFDLPLAVYAALTLVMGLWLIPPKIRRLKDMADAHQEASRALQGEGDQLFGERAALDVLGPDGRMTYYSDVVARSQASLRQMNPEARVIVENAQPRPRLGMLDDLDD